MTGGKERLQQVTVTRADGGIRSLLGRSDMLNAKADVSAGGPPPRYNQRKFMVESGVSWAVLTCWLPSLTHRQQEVLLGLPLTHQGAIQESS